MTSARDLLGQRYGKLLVTARAPDDDCNRSRWVCRCDCGAEVTVLSASLARGATQSCGCHWAATKFGTRDEKKRQWRRQKLRAAKEGKTFSAHENAQIKRVMELLDDCPASVRDISAALDISKSCSQSYVSYLVLGGRIEVAYKRVREHFYKPTGADITSVAPIRCDGSELAAALGYVARPAPKGGRVHLFDDEREAA